jgi:hypothetical protein
MIYRLTEKKMKTDKQPRIIVTFAAALAFLLFLIHHPQALAEEGPRLPEIESGKVSLSWPELKRLLDELEDLKRTAEKIKKEEEKKLEAVPVAFSIASAEYSGTVEGETGLFKARFSVRVLKDGWVTIPFFNQKVSIEEVHIDSAPRLLQTADKASPSPVRDNPGDAKQNAQFVRDAGGYALVARGPGAFAIETAFRAPLEVDNFVQTLNLVPPRSVINRVSLRIPGKGVRLIEPIPMGQVVQHENETTFQSVLGETDAFRLSWKIEKDAGMARKKQVTVHSLMSVDKNAVSVLSKVSLRHIESLDQLAFEAPSDVEIINLTSPAIERWHVEQKGNVQIIKVSGQPDLRSDMEISLSYRVQLPSLPARIDAPIVDVQGIDTMEGFLGVEIVENVDVTAETVRNGTLVSAKNMPKDLWNTAASPLLCGYEYHSHGFCPTFTIKSYQEIQTVVANVDLVDCVTHRTLEGKSVTRMRYFIRNNDRQFLTLTLPENSHIWQAFLDGKPVKPAQKETGEMLIPMKKSPSQGEEFRSFLIEIGYITEVSKLSLKGDIVNQLPRIDIPTSYLRWRLYLPEYYGYTKFEGPLKQVKEFSNITEDSRSPSPSIDLPTQGQLFLFEKFLIVDETPYVKGKYGQYLGDDVFLSVQPESVRKAGPSGQKDQDALKQQVLPNRY